MAGQHPPPYTRENSQPYTGQYWGQPPDAYQQYNPAASAYPQADYMQGVGHVYPYQNPYYQQQPQYNTNYSGFYTPVAPPNAYQVPPPTPTITPSSSFVSPAAVPAPATALPPVSQSTTNPTVVRAETAPPASLTPTALTTPPPVYPVAAATIITTNPSPQKGFAVKQTDEKDKPYLELGVKFSAAIRSNKSKYLWPLDDGGVQLKAAPFEWQFEFIDSFTATIRSSTGFWLALDSGLFRNRVVSKRETPSSSDKWHVWKLAWDSPTGKFAFRPISAGKYLSAKGNDLDLVTNLGVSETELFDIVRGNAQPSAVAVPKRSDQAAEPVNLPMGQVIDHLVQMVHYLSVECLIVKDSLSAHYSEILKRPNAARDDFEKSVFVLSLHNTDLYKLQKYLKAKIKEAANLNAIALRKSAKAFSAPISSLVEVLKTVLDRKDESNAAKDRDSAATLIAAAHFHVRNFIHTADLLKTQHQDFPLEANWREKTKLNENKTATPLSAAAAAHASETPEKTTPAAPGRPVADPPKPTSSFVTTYKPGDKRLIAAQKIARGWVTRMRFKKLIRVALHSQNKSILAARQRFKVFAEILQSERAFVTLMTKCQQAYTETLRTRVSSILRDESAANAISQFFTNFNSIIKLNEMLKSELEKRTSKFSASQSYGDIFAKMLPMMRLYSQYINEYEDVVTIINKSKGLDLQWRTLLDDLTKAARASGMQLDLESILIQPVQRLPRYQLLIKELLKYTEEGHVDYAPLQEAMKKVIELNQYINSAKKERDSRRATSKTVAEIKRVPFDLFSNLQRTFVRDALLECRLEGEKSARTTRVYFFNDMLIFAHPLNKTECEYAAAFNLRACSVKTSMEELKHSPFAVRVTCADSSAERILFFATEAERQQWMSDIRLFSSLASLGEACEKCMQNTGSGFRILQGSYASRDEVRDVSAKLKDICTSQGGTGLSLKADENRGDLFGITFSFWSNASPKLTLVYSVDGQIATRSYSDWEPVKLPPTR